ncbi:cytochrome P450 [Kibdelosporangium banguiense]|uniref:Cytochrome P450 n=1 Tax=Kibdelosporangium banguiense TaxID=1365924 RepID=A0ABS4TWS2_9PSEU|nr:cytochrome P450 [Kibdelosporangium banguiense]MBP2328855.1 cytochrome P450 [Kibdelosporangium banguiense]
MQPTLGGPASPPPGCPAHDRIPLYDSKFAQNPAVVYDDLRRHGPAALVELAPGVPAMLVTGYAAALRVLQDSVTFRKDPRHWQQGIDPNSNIAAAMMYRPNCMFADGLQHDRLRGAVTRSLAKVDRHELAVYTRQTAEAIISQLGGRGHANLLTEYAMPLALRVFTHMFGCPQDLADKLMAGTNAIFDGGNAEQTNAMLEEVLHRLITLKRDQPGDDVLSWMLADEAQLTEPELMHQVLVVMGAGGEPEANLITNALLLMLSDERFAGDLYGGTVPVDQALDHVLWHLPPISNYGTVFPTHDVEFEGTILPAHQPVVISFAAANTDPALGDPTKMRNRAHLAWSAGRHACPAQEMARLIATNAVERILDRLPGMELAVLVDELTWREGPFHRALTALPVRFPRVAVPALVNTPTIPATATVASTSASAAPRRRTGKRLWARLVSWWHGE